MSNQLNNYLVKPSGFIIRFFDSEEPDTGSDLDSEKWPDIRLDSDETGYPVHP